jgi:DNA-binding NtrC family response regulator
MSNPTQKSSNRPSGHRSKLVLLIDDDAGIRYVLQEVLRHHGYQIETAATVEEAKNIKQHLGAETIGVVIVEIHLTANPRFYEGYSLYEEWSALHPTLPFLLISGIYNSQDLPAIRAGMVPFLAKPFTMDAFLTQVQQLLTVPNTSPGMPVESDRPI